MSRALGLPKNDFFYISGLIAFVAYFFCFILFALYISAPEVKKFDSFTKNTVLELDVMIIDNAPKEQVNKSIVKNTKKSEDIVKKSASKTAKQTANVKSLFANVKTQSNKVLEKEINNVAKSEVASRFKSKFEKQRKTADVSVSKLLDSVKSKAMVRPSTDSKNNNDPYFSKIYELLASKWQPMFLIDGLTAKVLVIISSSGEFDFRVRTYSDDERFNDYLKSFLNEQRTVAFPVHSSGRGKEIEVIFGVEKG